MIRLIPQSKIGHGLMVFCNKCKSRQSQTKKCTHKEYWRYKSDFQIDSKRYTKVLKSENLDDAFKELVDIKDSIRKPKAAIEGFQRKGHTVYDGMLKYYYKITCQNEFEMNKPKSKDHQKECVRIVGRFGESLEMIGIDPRATKLDQLNTNVLKNFYDLLKNKYRIKSESSINKHTRVMKHFFNTLKKANMYENNNLFGLIQTSSISSNPISISNDEFNCLLNVITKENGYSASRGVRNLYTTWLKSAIMIGRHTGLRRDEIYNLRWSDIIEHSGVRFFNVRDQKVSLQKGVTYLKPVPLTDELYQYLKELPNFHLSEKIIDSGLAPSTFRDKISRAFTHFFKIAYQTEDVKKFKHLRKTHFTELRALLGDKAYLASGHSSNIVLEKHYIDRHAEVIKITEFKNKLALYEREAK